MIEFFFKLIRSGLYGTQLSADDVPANVDWDQVVELASRQTLLGVMADAVLRLPPRPMCPQQCKTDSWHRP